MLVSINQIKVTDRIRKDFGNIEELAQDIKDNGLINPPVVTPEYELIAGERRLRACKSLGYQQIEVRVMTVKDALHQLKLEISENENRKDFSFSEKMEWAEKLKEEYSKIASVNKKATQFGNTVSTTLDEPIRTDEAVAKDLEMGKTTYRKAEYIYQNADDEMIKQLDEGKLSINKAYVTLKEQNKELEQEKEVLETAFNELVNEKNELSNQLKTIREEIDNKKPIETIVEVVPNDYNELKKKLSDKDTYYNNLKRDYDEKVKKMQDLEKQIQSMIQKSPEEQYSKKLKEDTILFCAKVENFISQVGGLAYLSNHITDLPNSEKKAYIKCVELIEGWAFSIKANMQEYL